MTSDTAPEPIRFGDFELDPERGDLRRGGRNVRLQPQPLKLLALLARHPGTVVTRAEIRQELWAEGTFVDFDQAVNFAIRQIRDALRDNADKPLYVETVPRRGYRFIAPVDGPDVPGNIDPLEWTAHLQKALWVNIAELRLADARRRRNTAIGLVLLGFLVVAIAVRYLLSH